MYGIIDNLIFPAPKSSYSFHSLQGNIIFIPKFDAYKNKLNLCRDSVNTHKDVDNTIVQNEDAQRISKIRWNSIFLNRQFGRNHMKSQ